MRRDLIGGINKPIQYFAQLPFCAAWVRSGRPGGEVRGGRCLVLGVLPRRVSGKADGFQCACRDGEASLGSGPFPRVPVGEEPEAILKFSVLPCKVYRPIDNGHEDAAGTAAVRFDSMGEAMGINQCICRAMLPGERRIAARGEGADCASVRAEAGLGLAIKGVGVAGSGSEARRHSLSGNRAVPAGLRAKGRLGRVTPSRSFRPAAPASFAGT